MRLVGLDLGEARTGRGELQAASLALLAAGLNPTVYGPSLPNLQYAIAVRPDLESAYLVSIVVTAGMFLLGGLFGDLYGRRRALVIGLAALAVANVAGTLTPGVAAFVVTRIAAGGAVGLIIPVSIAVVAIEFERDRRAAAIGIAYAVFGLGTLAGLILLAVTARMYNYWPSLLVVALVAAIALAATRRVVRADGGHDRVSRSQIGGQTLWAFGLLSITIALIGLGGDVGDAVRLGLGAIGVGALVAFNLLQRRNRTADPATRADLRPLAFALVAGVAISFSQSAALLVAPLYFRVVQGFGSIASTIAVAPMFIGIVVAGPVAGILLRRLSPRVLVAGGLAVVGAGDLLVATSGPTTEYLYFVLPFLAIGAGFVIGTTIRTGVVFASVPRRLPATAAALNQVSIIIGSQLGIVLMSSIVVRAALSTFRDSVATMPPGAAAVAVDQFEQFLRAIGTSEFAPLLADLDPATIASYGPVYASAVSFGLVVVGLVGLAGAVVCWFGVGPGGPLISRWEYREERLSRAPVVVR
jgi:MFS family permease